MAKLISFFDRASTRTAALLNRAQSPLLLLIRLYWGWQFAQTGWGKLQHLDRVAQFFATLGLPAPGATAVFVALVELVGGILFALGVGSRLVPLVLFVNMTVAYWTADREAFTGILSAPDKFYAADPYTFWFAALLILVFGPGYLALDTLIGRWLAPKLKA
ncbi:MAG: DoxX family protein [Terracidiphilus sp.]|jgi:putative oxidoreductase